MRRTSALVSSVAVVTVLSAALVGCAASPDDVTGCEPLVAGGDASALVEATGEVGSAPEVSIPVPLVADAAERTVLEKGEGLVARVGMTVDFDAAVYDGRTGDLLIKSAFNGTQGVRYRAGLPISSTQDEASSLARALVCAQPGERIALATPADDTGIDLSGAGVTGDSTVVVVLDVQEVFLGKADGVNQLPQDGLPVVVTAPDGTVGVTVPSGIEAPTENRTAVIKRGSGPKLAAEDLAVLQSANWVWPTGDDAEIDEKTSTWDQGKMPETVALTASGDQAIPSVFLDALIGLPVGSQVLVVVAPTAESTNASIFVFDVLGIQSAPGTR